MSNAVPTQHYAPSGADADDAPTAAMVPASHGSRFAAMMLDSLTVAVLVVLPLVQGVGMQGWHGLKQGDPTMLDNVASSLMLAWFGLFILAALNLHFVRQSGQSIGKKMLGIKVVRSDGSKAGLGRIICLRNGIGIAIAVVPVMGGVYSLIDVLMIFSESRRCIHDRIADTIVIKA